MSLKLEVPELNPVLISQSSARREARYLTHCKNVALILTHAASVQYAKARIQEYFRITNTELIKEETND